MRRIDKAVWEIGSPDTPCKPLDTTTPLTLLLYTTCSGLSWCPWKLLIPPPSTILHGTMILFCTTLYNLSNLSPASATLLQMRNTEQCYVSLVQNHTSLYWTLRFTPWKPCDTTPLLLHDTALVAPTPQFVCPQHIFGGSELKLTKHLPLDG